MDGAAKRSEHKSLEVWRAKGKGASENADYLL